MRKFFIIKKFFVTGFLLFVFSAVSLAQNKTLPDDCRKILDENFRGWKFKKILPEIQKFLRESYPKNVEGNFVSGDWNGDGKTDYAVLIDHGNHILNDGTKLSRDVSIAFVRRGNTFRYFVLDTSGDYLAFEKKGTTAYDHNTQSGIRFSNDAISVGLWEKSARAYVWRKNKFIYFATSD